MVTLSRTRSILSTVPPTRVAFALGTGGNSGSSVEGSTAIEMSSESSVIDGFRGSIAASALASDFGEIIADEDGSLGLWATAGLVKSAHPAAIVAQESRTRMPNAGFTPQLDADPGLKVVKIGTRVTVPHGKQIRLFGIKTWSGSTRLTSYLRGRRRHAFQTVATRASSDRSSRIDFSVRPCGRYQDYASKAKQTHPRSTAKPRRRGSSPQA